MKTRAMVRSPAPVIVCSTEDIAGMALKKKILGKKNDWESLDVESGALEVLQRDGGASFLMTIEEPLVAAVSLDEYCTRAGITPSCYLFASRHRSESGTPALLAHVTGNWGDAAELGGDPRALGLASGRLLRAAFLLLLEQKERNSSMLDVFNVNMEVTHHGPTCLKHPLVFVELGSDESHWTNEAGAAAVATVILQLAEMVGVAGNDVAKMESFGCEKVAIGFGGPHYGATFDRVMRKVPVAFSHVVPKHEIEGLTGSMVKAALDRTVEKVDMAVLDWKGMNRTHKDVVLPVLEGLGLEVVRAKHLIKDQE